MKQAHAEELESRAGRHAAEGGEDLPELDTQELAERIARLAAERKAQDVRVLRVRELVHYTDWFVVVSGRSDRQVAAICDHVKQELKKEGVKLLSAEGTEHNQWAVLDFGDAVVHVFYEPVRDYYQLESLWADAPELDVELPEQAPATTH